jgi:hypothetical protein
MFAASKSGKLAGGDPYFNSTVALLETTGTNGQQNNTFLDSSTNNFAITRTGTPTQGTFTPFSQTGWSGNFNGTTDYVTASNNAAFEMGAGDYTVECWFYATPADATIDGGLVFKGQFQSGTATWLPGFGIRRRDDTRLYYYFNTSTTNAGEIRYVYTGTSNSNAWHHVAMVVQAGIGYAFLDGVLLNVGGTSGVGAIGTSSTPISIGIFPATAANIYFPGYISNLRIVKGTALYTSNFTPSTIPLTAISGTSLLTLQSNRFKDNSSNNFAITAASTPSIQAFSPLAPPDAYSTATVGGSGYFNGTADYLNTPSASGGVLDLTTVSVFTVEAWVYCNAFTGGTIISNRNLLSTTGFDFRINATGTVTFYYTATAATISTTSTLVLKTWNHVAIVRNGANATIFINGINSVTSSTFVNGANGAQAISIGNNVSSAAFFNGYISNLRILNGTALYTANFTPPAAPLTAVTNTSILLNETNAGIYDATAKNDVTTVGTAQVSTAQSKFGGSSMLFNGTTAYLTAINTPNIQLGTGNFTIEGWVYLTTGSTARGYISKGPSAATTGWELLFTAANFLRFEWTTSFIVGATTIPTNTWTHVAVVRSGSATGNVKAYVNGTLYATSAVAVTDNFNQTEPLRIGINRASTQFFPGYTDDIRITKGIARYTANFTPPMAAFPVS